MKGKHCRVTAGAVYNRTCAAHSYDAPIGAELSVPGRLSHRNRQLVLDAQPEGLVLLAREACDAHGLNTIAFVTTSKFFTHAMASDEVVRSWSWGPP